MKNKIWIFLKPIVVLTAIAAVMAGLLGGTNLLTTDRIKELEAAAETAAVEKVIKAETYEKNTFEYEGGTYTYFKALKGGEKVGYAFTLSANGYGGAVKCVVGIEADGKITAVEITDVANETPSGILPKWRITTVIRPAPIPKITLPHLVGGEVT